MNLRNRRFEKAIRPRLRAELRRQRVPRHRFWFGRLQREYHLRPWFGRLFVLAILLSVFMPRFRSLDSIIGVAVFWALASAAFRAGQLVTTLRASPSVPMLAVLPLSQRQAFNVLWQGFLRNSGWTCFDFVVIYSLLAWRVGYGWNSIWAGLAMALVQWGGILSVAAFLVAYVPRRVFYPGAGLLAAAGLASWYFSSSLATMAEWVSHLGSWIPPTGWVLYAFGITRPSNSLAGLAPAITMAALLFLLPLALRRLGRTYVLPELAPAGESVRGVIEVVRRRQSDGAEADPCADIKAAIRTRQFLAGYNWQRGGWIERITARWLTPSQRLAAEFLTGANPAWSKWTIRFILIYSALLIVTLMFAHALPAIPVAIFAIWMFHARSQSAAWPGTSLRRVAGMDTAVCSVYPVGFWQIAAVVLKASAVRFLVSLPFLAGLGLALAVSEGYELGDGSRLVLKLLLLLAASVIYLPVFLLSAGTNDAKQAFPAMLFVSAITLVGVSALVMFLAGTSISIAAAFVLVMGSTGVLLLYGRAYNHNWFDLQRRPDQQKQVPGQ